MVDAAERLVVRFVCYFYVTGQRLRSALVAPLHIQNRLYQSHGMWTANQADMFGNNHFKYIPWYIELDPENPMIWDDEFVKLCYNELQ
jgi:hypothetical protein